MLIDYLGVRRLKRREDVRRGDDLGGELLRPWLQTRSELLRTSAAVHRNRRDRDGARSNDLRERRCRAVVIRPPLHASGAGGARAGAVVCCLFVRTLQDANA